MLLICLCVVVAFVIALFSYARWNYGILEKMGLPVDKPHFIFGNTYYTYHTPGGLLDIENFKKFGPIYGVYEGREPQVHICDADLIRLVTTKDADHFNSKRPVEFRDPLLNEMIDFQPYDKWKILRSSISSQFSSAKIKFLSKSMADILTTFAEKLKETVESSPGQKLEKYDLRTEIYALFTDGLARSYFSLKIDDPSDPDNKFVNMLRGLLEPINLLPPLVEVLTYSFPFVAKFLPPIFDRKRTDAMLQLFLEMMDRRRLSRSSSAGVDSGDKDQQNDGVDFLISLMDKVDTPEFRHLNISKHTVGAQAFALLFAGQDQIASSTATMIYNMLLNPEVEDKIYQEVDTVLESNNGEIKYEVLSQFQYLLAALTEAVRLNPFFHRTERVCTKDWRSDEFNLHIKKGTVVQVPIWAANRNPKYFSDPEEFQPDRFLPGRKEKLHPYAMTSFGFGPRNCMGQKFANDLMIITCAFLFKHFKFHLRKDSKPVYLAAGNFFTPHLPFWFDVTLRE